MSINDLFNSGSDQGGGAPFLTGWDSHFDTPGKSLSTPSPLVADNQAFKDAEADQARQDLMDKIKGNPSRGGPLDAQDYGKDAPPPATLASLGLSPVDPNDDSTPDGSVPQLPASSVKVTSGPSFKGTKSPVLSALTNNLNDSKIRDLASSDNAPDTASNPLNDYQSQLAAAQAAQKKGMNNSVLRGASTDALNAALVGSGNPHQLTPGYADERLNQMNDLGLKNLQENLQLPGQVAAGEKAKIDMNDQKSMDDKNSPTSQLYKQIAAPLFGADKDPAKMAILNNLSGNQVRSSLDTLAPMVDKQMQIETNKQHFQLMYQEGEDKIAATRGEAAAKNKLAEAAMDTKQNNFDSNQMINLQKTYNADPTVKAAQYRLDHYDELMRQIKLAQTDSVAAQALPLMTLKYVNGGGTARMSKDLLNTQHGSSSVLGKLEQLGNTTLSGTLDSDNAAEHAKNITGLRDASQKALQDRTLHFANTAKTATKGRLDTQSAAQALNPDLDFNPAANPMNAQQVIKDGITYTKQGSQWVPQ